MKKLTLVFTLCLFVSSLALAGKWVNKGIFPPDSSQKNFGIHGLAVDPEGKVWICNYYATGRDSLKIPTDSVTNAQGRFKSIVALQIYKADGTKASFHPILNLTMENGSKGDTLGGATLTTNNKWSGNSGRGLRTMYDGNILAAYWYSLYQINYKTGKGIRKVDITSFVNGLAGPDVDENGNVFATNVFGGFPVKMFDKSFNLIGNVTDTTRGFNRTLVSSKDGKDVFEVGYTVHAGKRFHSDVPGLIPYTLADTVFKGMDIEAGVWDPKGRIWVASGSYNDLPNRYAGKATNWDTCMYYCFTPPNYVTPTDSIKQVFFQATKPNERPRAIAFSPSGDTAYIGSFSSGIVQRIIYDKSSSVSELVSRVATDYSLSQNFPNPFNPSTKITFSLPASAQVTLKVFDVLGREIGTLAEGFHAAGTYTSNFDAKGLPTGMYIYSLKTSTGYSKSMKMMLTK